MSPPWSPRAYQYEPLSAWCHVRPASELTKRPGCPGTTSKSELVPSQGRCGGFAFEGIADDAGGDDDAWRRGAGEQRRRAVDGVELRETLADVQRAAARPLALERLALVVVARRLQQLPLAALMEVKKKAGKLSAFPRSHRQRRATASVGTFFFQIVGDQFKADVYGTDSGGPSVVWYRRTRRTIRTTSKTLRGWGGIEWNESITGLDLDSGW